MTPFALSVVPERASWSAPPGRHLVYELSGVKPVSSFSSFSYYFPNFLSALLPFFELLTSGPTTLVKHKAVASTAVQIGPAGAALAASSVPSTYATQSVSPS